MDVVERVPFLLLGMELPPTPLFKDALEKNIIPQVGVGMCTHPYVWGGDGCGWPQGVEGLLGARIATLYGAASPRV